MEMCPYLTEVVILGLPHDNPGSTEWQPGSSQYKFRHCHVSFASHVQKSLNNWIIEMDETGIQFWRVFSAFDEFDQATKRGTELAH